jgi:hypothetical protein
MIGYSGYNITQHLQILTEATFFWMKIVKEEETEEVDQWLGLPGNLTWTQQIYFYGTPYHGYT